MQRKRAWLWVAGAVAATVVIGAALSSSGPSGGAAVTGAASTGDQAPEVRLTDFQGEEFSLSDYEGRPVVLNFWASWCGPCRDEAPLLERAWRTQARPTGVLMLGLTMQDVTGDARAFLREFDVTYPNVRDPTNETARRYGVTGLPETFFISAAGQIVGHVVGVISDRQLTQGIAAARRGVVLGARSGGDSRPTR